MRKQRMVRVMAWAVVCVSTGRVMGQTATWSGLGATNDWGDVGNWVEGVVPGTSIGTLGNWEVALNDSPRAEVVNDGTQYMYSLTSNYSTDFAIQGTGALGFFGYGGFPSPPPTSPETNGFVVQGAGSLTVENRVYLYGGNAVQKLSALGGDLRFTGALDWSGSTLDVRSGEGKRVAITGVFNNNASFQSRSYLRLNQGQLDFSPTAVTSNGTLELEARGGTIRIGSAVSNGTIYASAYSGGRLVIDAPILVGILNASGGEMVVNQDSAAAFLSADQQSTVVGSGIVTAPNVYATNGGYIGVPVRSPSVEVWEGSTFDGPLLSNDVRVTTSNPNGLPSIFGPGTRGSQAQTVTFSGRNTNARLRFLAGSQPVANGGIVYVMPGSDFIGNQLPPEIMNSELVAPIRLTIGGLNGIFSSTMSSRVLSSVVDVSAFETTSGRVAVENSTIRTPSLRTEASTLFNSENSTLSTQNAMFAGPSSFSGSALSAHTATFTGSSQFTSSTFTGSSVSFSAALTVGAASALNLDRVVSTGPVAVRGGSTVSYSFATVSGSLTVSDSRFAQVSGTYTGGLTASGSSVVNLDIASLSPGSVIQDGASVAASNATITGFPFSVANQSRFAVGSITTFGQLTASSGSTVSFSSGSITQSVTLQASSLQLTGSVPNRSRISGDALSTLSGTIVNEAVGTISHAGVLIGTLTNRGVYDQVGTGNLVGTYIHEGTATLSGSPSVSGQYVINGPLNLSSGRAITTRTSAELVNNSVITLGLGGGVNLGGGTFTNNQTFSGQGAVTNTKVLNRGTVTISSNQLGLRGGSRLDNLAGSVTLGAAGELNLDVTSLLTSAATFNINGGRITGEGRFVNNPGGRLSGQGLVDVEFSNGGEVSPVGGTLTIGRAFSSNGTIRLTVDGVLAGGVVTNTGRVYGDGIVSSDLVNAAGGRIDPTGTISVARPLANAGTLLLRNGGTLVTLGGFAGGVNNGTISLAGGQFDGNTSTVVSNGLVSGYGGVVTVGFTNAGLVSLAGGTTLWNGPVVNNSGKTVRVEFGTALFNGAFTNNGNVVVGTGGAVVFAGGSGGGLGEGGGTAVMGTGRMQVVGGAGAGGVELDGVVQGRLEVAGDVVMRSRQDDAGVQVRGASVSRVGVISITGQGFVDLVDNDLVVTGMGVGSVREMVRTWLTGGAGGLPGEVGLGSSVAFYTEAGAFATLAVYDNSVPGQTMGTFGGVAVGVGDVLVKYTYMGDANLDGVVDATDLSRVIAGMNGGGGAGGGWNFGDVNYDGQVNAVDLGRTMAALRGQGAALLGGAAGGGVGGVIPEPGMVGVLGVVAMGMGRRRR